ncbi:MAG: hypothetical protein GC154_19965 [bacterium]|nr:hypothetical protein [bacterium]
MVKRPPYDPAARPTVFLLAAQCLLCFQLAATAIYYNGHFTDVLVNKFLLAETLSLSAWLAYLFHCIRVRAFFLVRTPYDWPMAIFTVWAMIRALTSSDVSAQEHAYVFLLIVSAYPLWTAMFVQKRFRLTFVWIVAFIGLVMMIGCLRQLSTSKPGFDWPFFQAITLAPGSYERQRLCSFLGHNNSSTAYIAICGLYAAWLASRMRSLWSRGAFIVYVSLGLVLIVLGGSRSTALMVLAAALFLAAALWARGAGLARGLARRAGAIDFKTWGLRGAGLAVLLVAMFFSMSFFPRIQEVNQNVLKRFTTSFDEMMTGTYPRVWWMSLLMVSENPLTGVGFTAWPQQYPQYQADWFEAHPRTSLGLPKIKTYTLHAHNDYLHAWAETGLPGLFCVLWALAVHARCLRRVLRNGSWLGVFAGAATLATLTRSLAGFPFDEAAASCLFIANLALTAHYAGAARPVRFAPAGWARASAVWLAAPALAAIVGYFILARPVYNYILGDYLAKLHTRYANDGLPFRDAGDVDRYNQYLEYGFQSLKRSLVYEPDLGANRYSYAIELFERGAQASDETMVADSITEFERALESYSYYEIHVYLGKAWFWLWHNNADPESPEARGAAEKAIARFQQASRIMPIDETVYPATVLAMAMTGDKQAALKLVEELELKYPGLIARALLPAAYERAQSGDSLAAAYLYSLSAYVKPENSAVFRETVEFYLHDGRPDLARDVYLAGVELHMGGENEAMARGLMVSILERFFERGDYETGYRFVESLQAMEAFQKNPALWYYSTLAAWLSGRPFEAAAACERAIETGIPADQIAPLARVIGEQTGAMLGPH